MKKWLVYVGSTLLVLAFMVQMGWLEIIGIHRVSFGGDRPDEVNGWIPSPLPPKRGSLTA